MATTTAALLLCFCARASCKEPEPEPSCEDGALLQIRAPPSDASALLQGLQIPDEPLLQVRDEALLQNEAGQGTGMPWCRPRLCWSPYHHHNESQGDRPLCADALFELLVAVGDRLTALDYDWQICQGTLLGAIRDKDIIPWTADVDLCLGNESWARFKNQATAVQVPWRKQLPMVPGYTFGYERTESSTLFRGCEDNENQTAHQLDYDRRVAYVDISDSDNEQWPDRHSELHKGRLGPLMAGPKKMVEIRGRWFPAPEAAEEELEILYGPNWRTPDHAHSGHGHWRFDRA